MPMTMTGTLRLLLLLGGLGLALAAQAADPPARVARLGDTEGAVSFAPAGDVEWVDAPTSRPLVEGDRLWTDKAARAEVQAGSAMLRMDGLTQLELRTMDDRALRVALRQGSLALHARTLAEGENLEVDTPQLAWRVAYPGDFRLDVDPVHGTTRVTVLAGAGTAYGDGGAAMPLGGGQQVVFKGRALAVLATRESPPDDPFDRWVAERNRREDQSVAARHLPRELAGYQQLDAAGQWVQDATRGPLWVPNSVPAGWAPFRMGHWRWIAPWGWTWLDDAPWGFATSHYGRWTQWQGRWAWAPSPLTLRPVYGPAMVAFTELPGGGAGRGLAWFPLAPGEAWQPPYAASQRYVAAANGGLTAQPGAHAWQRHPDAVSVAEGDLGQARPQAASGLRVALASLVAIASPPAPVALPAAPGPAQSAARTMGGAQASAVAKAPAQATAALPAPPPERLGSAATAQAQAQPPAPPQAQAQTQAPPAQPQRQAQAQPQAQAQAQAQPQTQPQPQPQAQAQARTQAEPPPAPAQPSTQQAQAQPSPAASASARPASGVAAGSAVAQAPAQPVASAPASQARTASASARGSAGRAGVAHRGARGRAAPSLARRQARELQLAHARRAAERDAAALRRQRQEAEALAAWHRHQQAVAEQFKRDQQAWEQRQRGVPILRAGPPG